MYKNRLINIVLMGKRCVGTTILRPPRSLMQCFNTRNISHQDLMKSGCTMQKLREDLRIIMGVEKSYKPIMKSRSHLAEYLPQNATDLPTRSMADSYMTAILPLSTDIDLREKYVTFLGRVRIGRILEDMDIFAVIVAMRYIDVPYLPDGVSSPYTLVTAAVDRIDFSSNTAEDKDMRLSGHVTFVGRSSIEVVVWVDQKYNDSWLNINKSLFLLAARDSNAKKSAIVNKLKPATAIEEAIFNGGRKRRELRIQWQASNVRKLIPTQEEHQILHTLYLKSIPDDININKSFVPAGCIRMDQASASNLFFSQPEDRNFHNSVFGGFLMRQAMELAWMTCFSFTKQRPQLKCISDIAFNKPIKVNSMIRMHSYNAYTTLNFVQITLYAETLDAVSGESNTTNALHFTFECPTVVPEILPNTYHESMMYIDARRRFLNTVESEEIMNFVPIPDPHLTQA